MNRLDGIEGTQGASNTILENILSTLNRMDNRLRQIEGNTKTSDEESTCVQRKTNEAVLVCVRVNISSVSDIDTVGQEFTCELFLAATWEEPQLRGKLNASDVDWDQNWDPRIYFVNAVEVKSMHKKHKIIKIGGSPIPIVQLSYRVVGRFKTLFSLHNFPFDYQTLKVEISSKWSSAAVVFDRTPNVPCVLSNANFLGKEEWDLMDHVITKDSTSSDESSKVSIISYSFYSFEFHIKRKYTYFLTNIALLMFLISLLSFTTFFISPDSLGDRLSVILTLLLTAVTFKFVVSQSLPPVSYLTVLDWYVLSSVIFIFSVAVENSIVARIKNAKYQMRFDKVSWCVSICVFILMHICFAIKAAAIIRRVRRKLAYHQRCYKWKNGLLPACEELVSGTLRRSSTSGSPPKPEITAASKDPTTISKGFQRKSEGFMDNTNSKSHLVNEVSELPDQPEYFTVYFPSALSSTADQKIRFTNADKRQSPPKEGGRECKEDVVTSYRISKTDHDDDSQTETRCNFKMLNHKRPIDDFGSTRAFKKSKSNLQAVNGESKQVHGFSHETNKAASQISKKNNLEKEECSGQLCLDDETKQEPTLDSNSHTPFLLAKIFPMDGKSGISGFSNLATIKEDEILNESKQRSHINKSTGNTVSFSCTKAISIKEEEHTGHISDDNANDHVAVEGDDGDDDNGVNDKDESSSSDLSDSDVAGPIPKTESDINATLMRGRNFNFNSGRRLPRG